MGLGNERNQQTLGVFLLTQKPDPLNSSGSIHQIYLVRVKPVGLAEFTHFGYFGMFEESPQLSTSGSARLLVTIQSNKLLLLAAM